MFKNKRIVTGEFHKYAGPREMFGRVVIRAIPMHSFRYSAIIKWPESEQGERLEKAILEGIKRALLEEYGEEGIYGEYTVVEVEFSDNEEAQVPIAYREAAFNAIQEIFKEPE